jgi:hypothetical protein
MKTCVFGALLAGLVAGAAGAAEADAVAPGSLEELARWRKPAAESRMVVEGFLWVEAEDFADYGGWRLDTQFVHTMGSAYLLAGGVCQPVREATTAVKVPRAGTYRVWVRTRNWLKGYSPGTFTIAVNGKRAENVMGAGKPEVWAWERAGDFTLEAGSVRLALVDLSGAFARCDAVLLTRETGYVPPDDSEGTESARARFSGLPQEVADLGAFDVVVVGAGSAGVPAAVAAARNGARTALIHDRPVLGGNASDELGVTVIGAAFEHPNARECGIIEEAGLLRAKYGVSRKHGLPKLSEAFHRLVAAERNLTVFNNQRVLGVERDADGVIGAVKSVSTLTLARGRVRGKLFVDCTGDGWVGYYAGAQYRFGREAREEFGEASAPETADEITMSGLLMGDLAIAFRSEDRKAPVDYTPPEWAVQLPSPLFRNPRVLIGGEWWLEHPGTFNDLTEPERARDELVRIVFAYWGFLKNDWGQKEKTRHYALTYVPHMDARRETRRLVGDYIFREQDAREGRIFPDRISYGGWPLDLHHPLGIQSGKEGFYDKIPNPAVPIYTIPYRSIYSTNVPNLFMAGRCMSCTHMGLGTLRVQGTLATVGQAAGTAAALCLKHGVTPRELGRRFIGELQQELLKDDQPIPELVNEDPRDLARRATVTASSTFVAKLPPSVDAATGFSPENVIDGVSRIQLQRGVNGQQWHERKRKVVGTKHHQWRSDPSQPMPQWLELDFGGDVELTTVQLTFDTDLNRPQVEQPVSRLCVKDYRLEIPDKAGGWKEVVSVRDNFLRHRIHVFPSIRTSRIRVVVESTNGDLSARIFEIRAYGES